MVIAETKNKYLISDFIALAASAAFAVFIRLYFDQVEVFWSGILFATIIFFLVFNSFDLYSISKYSHSLYLNKIIKAYLVWIGLSVFASYLFKFDFSRGVAILWLVFSFVFIVLSRYFILKSNIKRNKDKEVKAIILGKSEDVKYINDTLVSRFPKARINIINEFNSISFIEKPELGVFVVDSNINKDNILNLLSKNSQRDIEFRIVANVFRLVTGDVFINEIDHLPKFVLKRDYRVYSFIKRLLDLAISTLLLFITVPFLLLVALFIKIESKGPVLILQKRVGQNGKVITFYKFRTMREDVNLYDLAPRENTDHRITKIGRFLRRTSLDELPQLWNIFRGDMSFVGPRPEMEFIVNSYNDWQKIRLEAKPGLTGLWQILGRKDIPLHENLEYDIYYIYNRSLFSDLMIVLKTIPVVVFGKGAY